MARVVSFSNQKGGVGKTTTCVNLASYFASFGYKTLLVDFDAQANASSSLGVFDKKIKNSIYSVLCGKDVSTCIAHTSFGLDFIPSSRELAGAEIELADVENREQALKRALEPIKDAYDFIFIDSAPTINLMLINALCASDGVIIPLQCEYLALEGLNQLLNTIRLVKQRLNNALSIDGIVLTMASRNRLCLDVENEIRKLFSNKLFDVKIPRNIRLAEAPGFAQPIMLYDDKCAGAVAYERLAKEYISKLKE